MRCWGKHYWTDQICLLAKSLQSCLTLCDPMDSSSRGAQAPLSMDSPGKNTGMGCHLLLQGLFLTQESKLHLLCLVHWQVNSLPLALPGIKFRQRQLFNVSWMNRHSLSKFYLFFGQKLTHFLKIPLEMQGTQNSWKNLEKWTTLDKSFLISRFTKSHKAIHKKLLA